MGRMEYQRTSHAVYELKYHLVWVPKYRKVVLSEPVARRLKMVFRGIAERYGFTVVEQEVMPDHVHVFVSAPPRWSPAELVKVLKSVSARQLFEEFPPPRHRRGQAGAPGTLFSPFKGARPLGGG